MLLIIIIIIIINMHQTDDIITLTFDLWRHCACHSVMRVIVLHPCTKFEVRRSLNGVTGHLLPPANFELATSFRSRLRVRQGQTDRRTDRRRPSTVYAFTLRGRRHNDRYDTISAMQWSYRIMFLRSADVEQYIWNVTAAALGLN